MKHSLYHYFLVSVTALGLCITVLPAYTQTLSDEQIKTLRQSSQAILRSRLTQKEEQQVALSGVREQLAQLQALVDTVEQTLLREQVAVSLGGGSPSTINQTGGIQATPVVQTQFRFDPSTQTIMADETAMIEGVQTQEASVMASTSASNNTPVVIPSTEANTRQVVTQALSSVSAIRNELAPASSASESTFLSRIQNALGLSSNQQTQEVDVVPNQSVLALANELETLLQQIERGDARTLSQVQAIKKRMQLTTPASELPELDPTISALPQ